MSGHTDQLRFTILEHDHPFVHWDLLMEQEESLATWRLLQKPETRKWIPAERIADHRMIYLDYEGPISNDRGTVSQFCSGKFNVVETTTTDEFEQEFIFTDCKLATRAFCRSCDDNVSEWRFE